MPTGFAVDGKVGSRKTLPVLVNDADSDLEDDVVGGVKVDKLLPLETFKRVSTSNVGAKRVAGASSDAGKGTIVDIGPSNFC